MSSVIPSDVDNAASHCALHALWEGLSVADVFVECTALVGSL